MARSRSSSRSLRLPAFLLASLALAGCDQLFQALEDKAQEAAMAGPEGSPDDQLGMKLQPYIGCINNTSSSVHRSMDRYFEWVDPEQGPTGSEKLIFGLFAINDPSPCIDGVAKVAEAEPRDADLEAAGTAYIEALKATVAIVDQAHKYYDQEDYKDDDFAKAKKMHPELVAAFESFTAADKALRDIVVAQNDALLERGLQRIEQEEGQKLRWHQAKLMHVAKSLLEATSAPIENGKMQLDLAKFEPAFEEYEAAVEALSTYTKANQAEASSVILFSQFVSSSEELQKAGKELMRRHRDGGTFTESELQDLSRWPERVDGSPMKFMTKYDELVQNSNRLNWISYKPNG